LTSSLRTTVTSDNGLNCYHFYEVVAGREAA
jgi:hypothetical protein